MKKILIGILAIGILTGCSTAPPTKIKTVSKIDAADEKQKEDKYIKTTIDAANTIQTNVNELIVLLSEMNDNDLTWKNDVKNALTNIKSAANDYTLSETFLSKENLSKYEKTSSFFGDGVSQLHSITDDGWKAVESYDKKILGELIGRLDPANELIKKGIEQLEIERNKKE